MSAPGVFKISSNRDFGQGNIVLGVPGTGYQTININNIVKTGVINTSLVLGNTAIQFSDPDLTSLAAATGTSLIYYRSSANTWSPVVMAPSMRLNSGILSSVQTIDIDVIPTGVPITTGLGRAFYHIPASLSGYTLSSAYGYVQITGNGTLGVQLARLRGSTEVFLLNPPITILANASGSHTSNIPPIIVTGDLLTNDFLRVDITGTGNAITSPLGLFITLEAIY